MEKLLRNNLFGMGLRHSHFPYITQLLEGNPSGLEVDYFEIITENFYDTQGRPLEILKKLRESFPISFHGVSLSLASDAEIDIDYLNKVKVLESLIDPFLVSDHLCWTGNAKSNLHNLLPFPYTKNEVSVISEKIDQVQNFLKRPLLLENLSAYIQFSESEMSEAEFLSELQKRTGCFILLDLNNLFVNSHNFKINIEDYLSKIPAHAVKEIHLSGFTNMGDYYFDTHSTPVRDDVWDIFQKYKKVYSSAVTTIEWDEDLPDYPTVLKEVNKAREYAKK